MKILSQVMQDMTFASLDTPTYQQLVIKRHSPNIASLPLCTIPPNVTTLTTVNTQNKHKKCPNVYNQTMPNDHISVRTYSHMSNVNRIAFKQ